MFDKITPIYNINENDDRLIKLIEEELEKITFDSEKQGKNLKIKSRVRSIHSSLAIEANSLSLESVSNIIDNKLVLGKPKEIQEVKNANELYEHIKEYDWTKEEDFLKAHMVLMKYFKDDNGEYRNHGEGVKKGDKIIFTAPDSILVPSLMTSLFVYIKNNKEKIHPLILSSLFHYYLVYIHPFTDGNGRIARFWVSLMLKDYNYKFEYLPIEEELYRNQEEYYESISKCHNNGNANVFINFMLKIIYNCILETTQKTTQKNIGIKLNENQIRIIELIKNNPTITREEMSKNLNITSDGVKYNLNKLEKDNIIERIGPSNGGYWAVKK